MNPMALALAATAVTILVCYVVGTAWGRVLYATDLAREFRIYGPGLWPHQRQFLDRLARAREDIGVTFTGRIPTRDGIPILDGPFINSARLAYGEPRIDLSTLDFAETERRVLASMLAKRPGAIVAMSGYVDPGERGEPEGPNSLELLRGENERRTVLGEDPPVTTERRSRIDPRWREGGLR